MTADAARLLAEIGGTDIGSDPFVAAVRATRMPMCITDARLPDNPIVFANESFCRLTGYPRAELIGRNCRLLQGPDTDHEAVARVRAAVKAGRPIEIDLRNHRKNGEPFWNRVLMAPVFDETGDIAYFFASQVDVTIERERLTDLESDNASLAVELADRLAALRASEARLRVATEAAAIGVWEISLPDLALTGTPTLNAVYGLGPGPTPSYAVLRALAHPDDAPDMLAAFERATAGVAEYNVTYRVRRSDGGYGWVEVRGQVTRDAAGMPICISGVSLDVTARRAAEAELRLNEESLRLATEAADLGTWDLDLTTDVLTWPDRTKAMFGMSPGAATSMVDFYHGLHPDDRPAVTEAFTRALDPAVRAEYDVEFRTVGKEDGVVRWVAARGKGLFDGDRCARAIGTAIDITRRRRAAEHERFLFDLSDAIRSVGDPQDVKRLTMLRLGDFLGVNRVGYAEADEDAITATLECAFLKDAVPIDGRIVLDDFGVEMMARMRAGHTIVQDDVATVDGVPAAWAAIGTRAHVAVPIIRHGKLRGMLFAQTNAPTRWATDDVRLIEQVAVRTWDAVERARAEAETSASEARLRAVIEAAPVGLVFASAPDGKITGANTTVERLMRHPVIPSPDVEGYSSYVAFHPDGRQVAGHEYPLARALAGEERPELEALYRRLSFFIFIQLTL